METTFPSSATKSSNCSLKAGVMCAFTWAVRFSLRMWERKAPGGKGGTAGGKAPRHLAERRRGAVRGSLLVLSLAGCATPIPQNAKYFSIEHGTMMFSGAMGRARTHCEEMGMEVRHLGTDQTGFQPVSRFECVTK